MERTFRNLMLAMLFGSVLSSGTAPYIITALLKDMDATLTQMALVPLIVQCGGLFGLPLVCLLGRMEPKSATILMLFLGRSSLVFLSLLLLTPLCGGALGPSLVLGLYAASVVIGASAGGPANLWFKEIVPSRLQGSFLGRRNAYGSLVVAALMPLFGFVLDKCSAHGIRTGSVFPILMIMPLVAGYLDLYFLSKVEPRHSPLSQPPMGMMPEFRKALWSMAIWRAAFVPALSLSGVLLLSPFAIILCFDLGMSGFSTGLMMAFSALGVACGMIYGGKLSDSSMALVLRLFAWLPLLFSALVLGLAVLSSLVFSGVLGIGAATAPILACFLVMALAQGMLLSAQVKYTLRELRDCGVVSFSLLSSIQNVFSILLLSFSIWLGAWASANAASIREFIPGFHYLHIVFACSITCGVLASILLGRGALGVSRAASAKGQGGASRPERTITSNNGDAAAWTPTPPSA